MKFSHLITSLPIAFSLRGMDRREGYFTHISNDSRKVHKDSIFVCITGAISDGHRYAQSAHRIRLNFPVTR